MKLNLKSKQKTTKKPLDTKTFAQKVEEVSKYLEKAKVNAPKAKDHYVETSIRFAKQVCNQLASNLQRLDSETTDPLEVADRVFDILMETDFRKLESAKNNFEFWYEEDQKYNS